jgi:hypothetical protein
MGSLSEPVPLKRFGCKCAAVAECIAAGHSAVFACERTSAAEAAEFAAITAASSHSSVKR